MNERLKNNIAILKRHNLTHEPVYHITDGKKHEVELIDEMVKDCEKIIKDEEQGLIVRLPFKVKQDKDEFFYYTEPLDEIDKKLGLKPKKIYLAFVQTVCEDFKETYCYGEDTKEFYDRHFTGNDDTIEIKLIKAEKKFKGEK